MSKKKIHRRQFSDDFKRRVVAEASRSGESWSQVARRYDLNANLLFRWKRKFDDEEVFLPVEVGPGSSVPTLSVQNEEASADFELQDRSDDRSLEIVLPCGTQLRCGIGTDLEVLSQALTILRRVT